MHIIRTRHPIRGRRHAMLLLAPLAALALAACGSDDDSSTTAAPATTATPATTAAPATTATPATTAAPATDAPAAGGVEVRLADTDLGAILVDGDGETLYLFANDTEGVSNCSGDCLSNWPPLVSDAAPAVGDGLDAGDFALITATDGSSQVTFHGRPLYYYAGDAAPGDMNGQAVGDVWYVVGADGNAVTG